MNIELLKEKLEQLKKRPNSSKGTIDQIEKWLLGSLGYSLPALQHDYRRIQ
jgi:hypothetical protein